MDSVELDVIAGKNPRLLMEHLPGACVCATGGPPISRWTSENRKRPYIDGAEGVFQYLRRPGDHGFWPLDPWLCVTAFRQLCPCDGIYVKNQQLRAIDLIYQMI